MTDIRFHYAFAVTSLDETRDFYGRVLGAEMGRFTESWQDFDLYDHQLSAHLGARAKQETGSVAGKEVPIPHFGLVMPLEEWKALVDRIKANDGTFYIEPHVRFENEPGEQHTCFVEDPSGNVLEFKGFKNFAGVFAK